MYNRAMARLYNHQTISNHLKQIKTYKLKKSHNLLCILNKKFIFASCKIVFCVLWKNFLKFFFKKRQPFDILYVLLLNLN